MQPLPPPPRQGRRSRRPRDHEEAKQPLSRWLLRIAVFSLLAGALTALGIVLIGYILSTTLVSTVQSLGTPAEAQPVPKESFDMGPYRLIAGYTFLGCTAITFLKLLTDGRRSVNGRSGRRRGR